MVFIRSLIVFAALLVLAAPAHSYFLNGNELYDQCKRNPGQCAGFIAGVADTLERAAGFSRPEFALCLPEKATTEQTKDVVMNELQQHPETRTQPAADIIVRALLKAFPCR